MTIGDWAYEIGLAQDWAYEIVFAGSLDDWVWYFQSDVDYYLVLCLILFFMSYLVFYTLAHLVSNCTLHNAVAPEDMCMCLSAGYMKRYNEVFLPRGHN